MRIRRYEKMSKAELIFELLERGISCFDEEDSRETMIEALYQEDAFINDYPETKHYVPRKSEW